LPSGLGLSILFLMISIFGPNLFMHLDAYFQPLVFRISFEKLTLDSLRSSSKLLNGYPGTQASSEIRLQIICLPKIHGPQAFCCKRLLGFLTTL
jgi:hypothetical protein